MKTILFVSDARAHKQISGISSWLMNTQKHIEEQGYKVEILDPSCFRYAIHLPTYRDVWLVLAWTSTIENKINEIAPDYIHIATEGPLGYLTRSACKKKSWKFTTSYHTRLPEYLYIHIPLRFLEHVAHKYMKWFHASSQMVVVTTKSLADELKSRGYEKVTVVSLGVDCELFCKETVPAIATLPSPVFVYFGRLAAEKNVEAFLSLKLPGSKLVIGDGPQREYLETKYKSSAKFVGFKEGKELVALLSGADVSVFPSKTDTFGLTIIESFACSLPVAAYNVFGPKDILTDGHNGCIDDDLYVAAVKALSISPEHCRNTALKYTWKSATQSLLRVFTSR